MTSVRTFWVAVLALCTWATKAQAAFDASVSSYLNIQIPQHLHVHNVTGGMEHNRAHFGAHWDMWKQEGHMALLTHYTQGDLCSMPNSNITKTFGEGPFFLLADMGACTPVSKARRAEALGASGLILVNHHCLCDEGCKEDKHCDEKLPYLFDDGSGASIGIPVMLIGKGMGEHVKSTMRKNEVVVMEMAWHLPKRDHNVSIALWYTPTHESTEEFLANFSSLATVLKDHLEFHPIPYIMDGAKMGCYQHADDEGSACYNMCTNNGRYCAISHGIHGKDVVAESLRRICVMEHYPEKGFWEYVNRFQNLCQSIDYFANKKCVEDALKHSEIKEDDINSCMVDAGDIDKDMINSKLSEAIALSEHIAETPTLMINWLPMRWPLQVKTVFESFCLGFSTGKAPHVCYACGYCGDPVACASRTPMRCYPHDGEVPEPRKSSTGTKKKSGGGFWKFMLVVFILTGIGGFVYYKKYMEGGGSGLGGYSLADALMSDTA